MLDESIISINELAKLKVLAASSGGGGAGTQFSQSSELIARARTDMFAFDTAYRTYASTSYSKAFNHGNGQFSIASTGYLWNNNPSTNTRHSVTPFTVNQTTGALTVASPQTVWSNSSGGCTSTNTWGVAGSYIFNHGNHCAPGYASNQQVVTACNVTGNSVSGSTYNIVSTSYAPSNNAISNAVRSGSTAYWSSASNSGGTAMSYVWSYNGSSLSNTIQSNFSSNTSTNFVPLIIPQFGNQAATTGSLTFFRNSNGLGQIAVLNSTGGTSTTVNIRDVLGTSSNANYDNTAGFELSNGQQIFFLRGGATILRSGSSITDITSQTQGFRLASRSWLQHSTPAGVDSWYTISEQSPSELIKWSINPSTYEITIQGSVLVTALTNENELSRISTVTCGGVWVTGSNNQFIVSVAYQGTYANGALILVGSNPLAGA